MTARPSQHGGMSFNDMMQEVSNSSDYQKAIVLLRLTQQVRCGDLREGSLLLSSTFVALHSRTLVLHRQPLLGRSSRDMVEPMERQQWLGRTPWRALACPHVTAATSPTGINQCVRSFDLSRMSACTHACMRFHIFTFHTPHLQYIGIHPRNITAGYPVSTLIPHPREETTSLPLWSQN